MIVTRQHRLMIPCVRAMIDDHDLDIAELALLVDVKQLGCLAGEHRTNKEFKVSIVLRHCFFCYHKIIITELIIITNLNFIIIHLFHLLKKWSKTFYRRGAEWALPYRRAEGT